MSDQPPRTASSGRKPAGVRFRAAVSEDLPAVAAIYNAGISERVATFEIEPRTVADLAEWAHDGRPFIVAGVDGLVLGWARAGAYSDRCVYSGVGEHAVYVSPEARGRGLGRALLVELCAEAERRGMYKLTSRVFADNLASRAAHRAAGFDEVGVQRRHGQLDGEWKDCVLVERLLGPAAAAAAPGDANGVGVQPEPVASATVARKATPAFPSIGGRARGQR
jgi:L-amino acid N-acyltransferase YncA